MPDLTAEELTRLKVLSKQQDELLYIHECLHSLTEKECIRIADIRYEAGRFLSKLLTALDAMTRERDGLAKRTLALEAQVTALTMEISARNNSFTG